MNETILSPWVALGIVGLTACLSAALGLLLYRTSAAYIEHKSFRLTGATAIAWVFFFGMGQLYLKVSSDIQDQNKQARIEVRKALEALSTKVSVASRGFDECSLQVGDFQCKTPAAALQEACQALTAELR